MHTHFERFVKKIDSPIRFGFFLATKLPAAFFVGLKLASIQQDACTINIKHNWRSKNPFHSMYFAAEAMAAEMSTGLLAFGHIYQRKPGVSMLVVKMEVEYFKKATGNISFICNEGLSIQNAIQEAMQSGEGKTITCTSIGKNEANEMVAKFTFTWSFKAKQLSMKNN